MPHITAHLTRNVYQCLDPDLLLADIVTAIHESDPQGFARSALRAKTAVSDHWHAADGNPDNATIHVEIHLLAGRDAALLDKVAGRVLDVCAAAAAGYGAKALSVSVEFLEMPRSHYASRKIGG